MDQNKELTPEEKDQRAGSFPEVIYVSRSFGDEKTMETENSWISASEINAENAMDCADENKTGIVAEYRLVKRVRVTRETTVKVMSTPL